MNELIFEQKEPKLKLKVDFNIIKEFLAIPMLSEQLKKGDIVELIDEKLGKSKKCMVSEVELIKNPLQSAVYFQALISVKGQDKRR